jgi:hypothetical protein
MTDWEWMLVSIAIAAIHGLRFEVCLSKNRPDLN